MNGHSDTPLATGPPERMPILAAIPLAAERTMQTLIEDLKQALRMLRNGPAFTATAVIALTLGIGVNTAIRRVAQPVARLHGRRPIRDRHRGHGLGGPPCPRCEQAVPIRPSRCVTPKHG